MEISGDIEAAVEQAWEAAKELPGFLTEREGRFLAMVAACAPAAGRILEIGSFKGKSTVVLATVCQRYGFPGVVAVDPFSFHSVELQGLKSSPEDSTYEEFRRSVDGAGVADFVEVRRALSTDVAHSWEGPLRFLWIDGDHTYRGAKDDFDNFLPHLVPGGIVAFHDALHEFDGPIRVFVEDVLRSDDFGAAGFVGSIAWAQYLPGGGSAHRKQRAAVERVAAPLIPYVRGGEKLRGLRKLGFKLRRSRVPRSLPGVEEWVAMLEGPRG